MVININDGVYRVYEKSQMMVKMLASREGFVCDKSVI